MTNLNTVGNGAPVLTGPGIVNKANAAGGRGTREAGNTLGTLPRVGGRVSVRRPPATSSR